MKNVKRVLHVYERPTPFVGLKGKDNARASTRSYYMAKREVFPSLDTCFINRFENAFNEEIIERDYSTLKAREPIAQILLPSQIEIKVFVQRYEKPSYENVLSSLYEKLKDLLEEARDGYYPEYIKIFSGEPYISLDALLFKISPRKLERNTIKSISRLIQIKPDSLISEFELGKRKEKRLVLPSEITTKGKDRVSLTFLDEETFKKAIKDRDYLEELQLVGLEYLRGREFRDSIRFETCLPFEEEIKKLAKERKTPWIDVEDLLFYVPISSYETTRYKEIYMKLFSTDAKNPGELYILMMDEKEYEETKKKLENYKAKKIKGNVYVSIEAVVKRLEELRENDEFKTRVERYGEITLLRML